MAADREHEDPISAILARTRRVAVLGIKTEAQANRPAFYVPQYLVAAGFTVVPVPVYYPEVREILGAARLPASDRRSRPHRSC